MTNEELREWMREHGYSIHALARKLGVWPSTVQRWRDGSRKIPAHVPLALEHLAATGA